MSREINENYSVEEMQREVCALEKEDTLTGVIEIFAKINEITGYGLGAANNELKNFDIKEKVCGKIIDFANNDTDHGYAIGAQNHLNLAEAFHKGNNSRLDNIKNNLDEIIKLRQQAEHIKDRKLQMFKIAP